MPIYHSVTELIGRTPLLELCNYERAHGLQATVLAKLECMNPAGSAKDRVAARMIAEAEAAGRLTSGGTIIEPTSGNTGIGLAAVAAARGYRVILTMPDTMSGGAPGPHRRLRGGDRPDARRRGHGRVRGQGGGAPPEHSRQQSSPASSRIPPTRRLTRPPPARRSGRNGGKGGHLRGRRRHRRHCHRHGPVSEGEGPGGTDRGL